MDKVKEFSRAIWRESLVRNNPKLDALMELDATSPLV